MRFLDTNIILRFLTRDDEAKAQACLALFERVERGQEEITLSEAILTEVCYVLSSSRHTYQLKREEIRARLLPLLNLRGLHLRDKRLYLRALDLYVQYPRLDIEDAVSVARMEAAQITEIYSYDTDFDGIPTLKRLEP
ncbi:MAG: type II toxin-antitoxin system VapC family toxin [Chloroflexi bacterium]|nr:type II toxin-antitoxin system VapC family toxin [Chloroflexota bacterium]